MKIESAGLVDLFQVFMSMFAANLFGRLGSSANEVVTSFRADLLSEETPRCRLWFHKGFVWRMWVCETCLDLELRKPLSLALATFSHAWSSASLDAETSPRRQHRGILNRNEEWTWHRPSQARLV